MINMIIRIVRVFDSAFMAVLLWMRPEYIFIWFYSILVPLLSWLNGHSEPTGLDAAAAIGINPLWLIAGMVAGNFAMVASISASGRVHRLLFLGGLLPALVYCFILLNGYALSIIDGRALLAAHYVGTLIIAGVTMFGSYLQMRDVNLRVNEQAEHIDALEATVNGRGVATTFGKRAG